MPQRSDQRTGDSVADDFSALLDDDESDQQRQSAPESQQSASNRSSASFLRRAKTRAGRIFSPRVFLGATLLLGAGMALGSFFVPIPLLDKFTGLLGVFAGAFLLGLAFERSTILESAAAGAVVAGLTAILGNLALTAFGDAGVPIGLFGAGVGLLAGALGAYFGGDLRKGLTEDI